MARVVGLDISLNHGAAVELTDGAMTGFWYYTDKAGSANQSREHGTRQDIKIKERQQKQVHRLAWVERWLDKTVLVASRPDFAGLEDYAIRAEQGAHYLGEVGGTARLLLWFRGVRFRLHDPISVKMYTTHDGTAQKDLVEAAVLERWGYDFSRFNQPPSGRGKPSRQTSEDLADAMAIAQLVWAEARLRSGELAMVDLEHDKERQVFNRVTKTYPVSLLGREWIHNPEGKPTPHGRHPACSSETCALQQLSERLGGLPEKLEKAVGRSGRKGER